MAATLLTSWIDYDADCEFPIQNIPFGVFIPAEGAKPRAGTVIGDQVDTFTHFTTYYPQ